MGPPPTCAAWRRMRPPGPPPGPGRAGVGAGGGAGRGARVEMQLGPATLPVGMLAGTAAAGTASSMPAGSAWMRWALLSPTGPVDIALFFVNDPMALGVLGHGL